MMDDNIVVQPVIYNLVVQKVVHDLVIAAPGPSGAPGITPAVQYSADGITWSDDVVAGTRKFRFSLDGKVTWSGAIDVPDYGAGVYLDKTTDFVKTSGQITQYGDITGFNSGLNAITGRLINIWDSQLDDTANCAMIGFPHNKLAFLTERGGSVSFSPDISSGVAKNLFDGSGANVYWANPTGNITVTISLPSAWSYMRMFMIQFYSVFFSTSFLVEYSKDGGTTWNTGFDITGWTRNYFCAPTGSAWYTTNAIRITFRAYNYASYLHICEIGWWNSAEPIDSYSLSKASGGDVYEDINLPTGKYYKINGVPHIHDISEDTTPQCGGDLDLNGKKIIQSGSGAFELGTNDKGFDLNENGVYQDYINDTGTTIDWVKSNKHYKTLSANVTLAFTVPSGAAWAGHIILIQNGSTAYTVNWPTIKWANNTAPVLTTLNSHVVIFLVSVNSIIYGSYMVCS